MKFFKILILSLLLVSCSENDTITTPAAQGYCIFTKMDRDITVSGGGGEPTVYNIRYYTTVKNTGSGNAGNVRIIVSVNGVYKGSIYVTNLLPPGGFRNKDFQTITSEYPELKIKWD